MRSFKEDWLTVRTSLKEFDADHYSEFGLPAVRMLIEFLIIGEDRRFYYHPGVDIYAIFRAIFRRISGYSREGASTIEQQLVRTLTQNYSPTLARKLREILLSVLSSMSASKTCRAYCYLHYAYYGTNYQSLDTILMKYGLSIHSEPDPMTCAEIISRLKYPEPRTVSRAINDKINMRTKHLLKLYYRRHDQTAEN